MRKVFVLALFSILLNSVVAQVDEMSVRKKMWAEKFPLPDSAMREEFKDESAVILHKSEVFEYKRNAIGAKVNTDSYLRMQLWLLDESAVEEYSELKFSKLGISSYKREGTLIGIKIIKPDGTERIVNLNDAVKMRIFRDAAQSKETSDSYNKVAIEDLEKGDILDFYVVNISRINSAFFNYPGYYAFDPEIVLFKSDYPILDGKVSFLVERNCYINLSLPAGYEYPVAKERDGKLYYELSYFSKEKIKSLHWTAPLVTEPVLKFQVIVVSSATTEVNKHFIGTVGKPKTEPEKSDYKRMLKHLSNHLGLASNFHKETGKFLKKQRRNPTDTLLISDLYYFTRNYLYFDYFDYYGMRYLNSVFHDEFEYIRIISAYLRKNNIAHEVFLGVDKNMGNIDKALIHEELTPGIKLETENGTLVIYKPTPHSLLNEGRNGLQGTRVYTGKITPGVTGFVMGEDTLPSANYTDNVLAESYSVAFTGEENQIEVKRNVHATGCMKSQFSYYVREASDYFEDEAEAVQNICILNNTQQVRRNNLIEDVEKKKGERQRERKEAVKVLLKEMNNIQDAENDTLIVKAMGRTPDEKYISFSQSFKTHDVINQAGDYLVVDVSKLFGKFAVFPDDEKERNVDVYMDCPRSLQWNIEINIPDGYSAGSLEVFNDSIKNSTGGFECFAREEFGKVVLQAHKYYLHDYEPVENWPELLSMLEFSNNISQQKIVFTKISAE